MPQKPETIEEYLSTLSGQSWAMLEELRQTPHKIMPGAEECISYGMPAFCLHGVVVAGFQATSLLPFG